MQILLLKTKCDSHPAQNEGVSCDSMYVYHSFAVRERNFPSDEVKAVTSVVSSCGI